MPISSYGQYWHPLVKPAQGDHIISGGIYDGYTSMCFANVVGEEGFVYGFEPMEKFWKLSVDNTNKYKNILIENSGLYSSVGEFYICDNDGGSHLVATKDEATEVCHTITIDSYVNEHDIKCSLIKLDIEGAELDCLEGAINTIGTFKPKLQISLYHKQSDYVNIPIWLVTHFPDYHLYIGHHSPRMNETCLYAIAD